jgi:hypothetical protein
VSAKCLSPDVDPWQSAESVQQPSTATVPTGLTRLGPMHGRLASRDAARGRSALCLGPRGHRFTSGKPDAIKGVAHRTPVVRSRTLDGLVGGQVWSGGISIDRCPLPMPGDTKIKAVADHGKRYRCTRSRCTPFRPSQHEANASATVDQGRNSFGTSGSQGLSAQSEDGSGRTSSPE